MTDEIKPTIPAIKEDSGMKKDNEAEAKATVSVLGNEVSSEPSKDEKEKTTKTKARRKNKDQRQISQGKAYIQATLNNTIITVTDLNGNAIAWASAGSCGFKGPKKATPYAASLVVKKIVEKIEPFGVREVNVYVSGVGQGRDSSVRAFNAQGLSILSIKDVTPIPHNGCRKPRTRRV